MVGLVTLEKWCAPSTSRSRGHSSRGLESYSWNKGEKEAEDRYTGGPGDFSGIGGMTQGHLWQLVHSTILKPLHQVQRAGSLEILVLLPLKHPLHLSQEAPVIAEQGLSFSMKGITHLQCRAPETGDDEENHPALIAVDDDDLVIREHVEGPLHDELWEVSALNSSGKKIGLYWRNSCTQSFLCLLCWIRQKSAQKPHHKCACMEVCLRFPKENHLGEAWGLRRSRGNVEGYS